MDIRTRIHIPTLSAIVILTTMVGAAHAQSSTWNEDLLGPLPRWREGGTPLAPQNQLLVPVTMALRQPLGQPTSGVIEPTPEYAPTHGVLFRYSSSAWPAVVRDLVVALTSDSAHDEIAYVVVSNSAQQSSATTLFTAGGADMSKVQFIVAPNDSIWLRDYGPHFIWQGGALAVADSHYYPNRPLDNFIPTLVAEDTFQRPAYHMGLYYSGGNFQADADRNGYITTLIDQDNPNFGLDYIHELYQSFQGIDTLHVFPRLPSWVDGTGHIDMWFYMIDDDTVIISRFQVGSDPTAIAITNNAYLYMRDLGFEVFRVPAWNSGNVHYTYTNAFRVNDRLFVPTYGSGNASYLDDDQVALDTFQEAAGPGVEIVPINSFDIIPAAGAIHCIVMQVPARIAPVPAAHVCAPDGGELLATNHTSTVRWTATDDVEITGIDLLYSIDGGLTYSHIIAEDEPNDGIYEWAIPQTETAEAVIKVVAHDNDGNWSAGSSETLFEIANPARRVYDFNTGAGIDRWGWGYQTPSWSFLEGERYPDWASTELSSSAYLDLAAADATGSDSDTQRYISPTPFSSYETTHIFEFTIAEPVPAIWDIGIMWEGYGDDCTQMELYVWDELTGNWCNGAGLEGENRYMDNYAGNRDRTLDLHLRSDFARYIDDQGRLTILVYGERPGDRSFHDYLSVVVSYDPASLCTLFADCADSDGDGLRDNACMWWECSAGTCLGHDIEFGDMGGAFGSCLPDGVADGHDRFHALNCFANTDAGGSGAAYPCEPAAPAALNVDAGGPFGSCLPDGVCDGNDAFHALSAFEGNSTCQCPADPQPGVVPNPSATARIALVAAEKSVRPGQTIDVDAYLTSPLTDLRGYQLDLAAVGGAAGELILTDIAVHPRKDHVFGGVADWQAYNVVTGQVLAGLDGAGVAVKSPAYLATFTYRVSRAARGRFAVELLLHEDNANHRTFLFATQGGDRIAVEPVQMAIVMVQR